MIDSFYMLIYEVCSRELKLENEPYLKYVLVGEPGDIDLCGDYDLWR